MEYDLYGTESGYIQSFDTMEELNKYLKDLKRFDKENNIEEEYYIERDTTNGFNLKNDDMWIIGDYTDKTGTYHINAKVYMEGSKYGINNGQVSKLYVSKNDKEIISYDRGWDIEPSTKYKKLLNIVIDELISFRNKHPYD